MIKWMINLNVTGYFFSKMTKYLDLYAFSKTSSAQLLIPKKIRIQPFQLLYIIILIQTKVDNNADQMFCVREKWICKVRLWTWLK